MPVNRSNVGARGQDERGPANESRGIENGGADQDASGGQEAAKRISVRVRRADDPSPPFLYSTRLIGGSAARLRYARRWPDVSRRIRPSFRPPFAAATAACRS